MYSGDWANFFGVKPFDEYLHAVACFDLLYALMKDMEYGDEIVFGDEIGSWMILGEEKQYLRAYMTAVLADKQIAG